MLSSEMHVDKNKYPIHSAQVYITFCARWRKFSINMNLNIYFCIIKFPRIS